MGNLVWIQGSYTAGAWPNIKIFTSCAQARQGRQLLPLPRARKQEIKCPKNDMNLPENLKMQGRVTR